MNSERPPARDYRRGEPPPGFGARPEPQYRPYRSPYAQRMDDGGAAAGARFAGVLLALSMAALIVVGGLWQVTAPAPAERMLKRILPPLTDLDQTLAAGLDTMREVALGVPSDGSVTVPGLPVLVEVGRQEALTASTEQLRALVLDRMAVMLYNQGAPAFRAQDAATREPSLFGSQWALQQTLNALTADRHDAFRIPRLVLIGLTILLGMLAIWLNEGPSRLISPGVSIVVGAVLAALAALVIWLGSRVIFGASNAADEIVRLVARDSAATIAVSAGVYGRFLG